MQLPMIAPIEKYDPIHDFSANVIAPVSSGDTATDSNNGNAGDNHPIAHP